MVRPVKAGKDPFRVTMKFKPFVVIVASERERLYFELKRRLDELENIINNDETPVPMKLKAMNLAARVCQVLGGLLKDTQLDEIEADIAKLKTQLKETGEAES